MQELSVRQKAILERIALAFASAEASPSIRELMQATGLNSTSSVQHHLNILQEMGYIKRKASASRAIVLTPKALSAFTGGTATLDEQDEQGRDRFATRVDRGDRLINSLRQDLADETVARKKAEAETRRIRRAATKLLQGFDKHGAFFAHTEGFKSSIQRLQQELGLLVIDRIPSEGG
jgi:SOS-response transcriptional repressor LexA